MYQLSFEIHGLPKMTNSKSRTSWRAAYGEAKRWKTKVFTACLRFRPAEPLKRAKVTLTRHSAREPDFDGLVSGMKHIIDGLVEAGILENDKMSVIGQPTYAWKSTRQGRGKVSVTVEELYV